jgi:hypothetical protein
LNSTSRRVQRDPFRTSPRTVIVLAEGTTENVFLVGEVFDNSWLHVLRLYFASQLDDPEKERGRGTALSGEPTVEIVGRDVEDQSDVRFAVVVDHIANGSYVEISVGHHTKNARKHCASLRSSTGLPRHSARRLGGALARAAGQRQGFVISLLKILWKTREQPVDNARGVRVNCPQ